MSIFEQIQEASQKELRSFISDTLQLESNPLRYFYLNYSFFEQHGRLEFKNIAIPKKLRTKLYEASEAHFKSYEQSEDLEDLPSFWLDGNDMISLPKISGIKSIFEGANIVNGITKHYEYIYHFVFYELLKSVVDRKNELNANEKNKLIKLVERQKINFLTVYLTYIFSDNKQLVVSPDIRGAYKKYTSTKNGKIIKNKLFDIDALNKEGKNEELREKMEGLYVLRELESKIHFVFSVEQSADNEEIREVLSIMQRGSSTSGDELLYRGQASAHWRLDSSLTRADKFKIHERELYYEVLSLKPDAFTNDDTVYERLITMQHYGMPTRLMDLSRNPLVAIFFACNNLELKNEDGAIFIFTPKISEVINFEHKSLDHLKALFSEDDDVEITENESAEKDFLDKLTYIRGVAKNQRITNQSGDFIFVGKKISTKDIEEKVEELIVIDAKVKQTLLELLEKLNVHGGAVYPDLTHMSNYIKDKYLKRS
jgi:hypothetical protein